MTYSHTTANTINFNVVINYIVANILAEVNFYPF
jgi:hypothetical protein